MKSTLSLTRNFSVSIGSFLYVKALHLVELERERGILLCLFCFAVLSMGMSEVVEAQIGQADDQYFREGKCNMFKLAQGSFGALMSTIAGIIAVVAMAIGAYKAAWALLMVGAGAFILPDLVSLFFNKNCGGGGGSSSRTLLSGAGAVLGDPVSSPFAGL